MDKVIGSASPKHHEQMELLREFCGADSISYTDHGDTEDYFLTKGDRTIVVKACYNRVDKGFLSVREKADAEEE